MYSIHIQNRFTWRSLKQKHICISIIDVPTQHLFIHNKKKQFVHKIYLIQSQQNFCQSK